MAPYLWTYVYECNTCYTKDIVTLNEEEGSASRETNGLTDSKRCVRPECRGTMIRTDLSKPFSDSFPPEWKVNLTTEQRQVILEKREEVFRRAASLVNECMFNLAPNQQIDHILRIADWLLQLPTTQE